MEKEYISVGLNGKKELISGKSSRRMSQTEGGTTCTMT